MDPLTRRLFAIDFVRALAIASVLLTTGCSDLSLFGPGPGPKPATETSGDSGGEPSGAETVTEPVAVGGAYLVCAQDPTLATTDKTAIGCALHASGRKMDLPKVTAIEARMSDENGAEIPSTLVTLTSNSLWHWSIQMPSATNLANAKLRFSISFEGGKEPMTFEEVITTVIPPPGAAAEPLMFTASLAGNSGQRVSLLDRDQSVSFKLPASIQKSIVNAGTMIARMEMNDDDNGKVICTYRGAGREMTFESCDNGAAIGDVHKANVIELNVLSNDDNSPRFTLTVVVIKAP